MKFLVKVVFFAVGVRKNQSKNQKTDFFLIGNHARIDFYALTRPKI